MRRRVWWISTGIVVAGLATLLFLRWDAWFTEPGAPEWNGKVRSLKFHCFGDSVVPGFEKDSEDRWQDTIGRDTLCVLVFGDIHNHLTRKEYEQIVDRHPQIDCYAQVGDWVERSQPYYIQQLYAELDSTRLMQKPVMNCPGNHEYHKGVKRQLPEEWTTTFHHPQNGPKGFEGSSFYVDFADIRWISLNTAGLYWLHDYTRQDFWLHEAIKGAQGRPVVVMMHHPIYASSEGRWYGWNWLMFAYSLKQADIVFSGHDHNYTRWQSYISLTSTRKNKEHLPNPTADCKDSGRPLYCLVQKNSEKLWVETHVVSTGEMIDSVSVEDLGKNIE